MDQQTVTLALKRAQEVLDTAFFGLRGLKKNDPENKSAGLRNVLVFGRSVTFVIQNLRSIVGDGKFDLWYEPKREQMRADPLMKYFVEARNNLEKQGRLDVTTRGMIREFNGRSMAQLERPPFAASSFFMGDETGCSGWEMDLGGGEKIKYYISIPQSIGEFQQVFHGLPENIPEELRKMSVVELCEIYLGRLQELMDDAKREFMPNPKERPYLRVVK